MDGVQPPLQGPESETSGVVQGAHRLLGGLEAEIMGILWARRRATVREVLQALAPRRPLAYTTILTVMTRLAEKGLLRRRRRGKAHQYEAAETEQQFLRRASQRLVRSLVADLGDAAVAAMADEIERVDPARLERLRLRLAQQEPPTVSDEGPAPAGARRPGRARGRRPE